MGNLYKGPGNIKDYDHSLEFLDRVFFTDNSEEPETHFLNFLPKLYKKEYGHCEKNMIVSLDGECQAAVGLYIDEMSAGTEKLLCGGIGNVAVSKNSRGMGYMKDCMGLCLEKCINENVDFMILGGQRQRYGYFGFEPAGTEYEYCLNKSNLRHTFGRDYVSPVTAHAVTESDTDALDFIFELYNKSFPLRVIRSREKFYDIIVSWNQRPFIFKNGDKNIGYAFYSECMGYVMETAAVSDEMWRGMLPSMVEISGKDSIRIKLPPCSAEYNRILSDICEEFSVNHCELINILNWKRMVYSLLKFKAERNNLCDGEKAFFIHGCKKDEIFTVKIENNTVTVTDGGENPLELSHKEAMQLFMENYSFKRNELKSDISGWFPLEFMLFSADTV